VKGKLQTWPRLLFFVIGVLPAAIKLASFSGVPWTQAWGLMFAAFFAIIEIITLLAQVGIDKHDTSVPAALGISQIEWQDPQQQLLRSKVARLSTIIGDLEAIVFLFVMGAQLGIGFWAVRNLCMSGRESIKLPANVYNVFSWFSSTAIYLFCLVFLTCVALKLVAYFLQRSLLVKWPFLRMLKWLGIGIVILGMLPGRDRSNNEYINGVEVWNGMCMFTWLCYEWMRWVCERFPAVAKALLIETRPSEVESLEGQSEGAVVESDDRLVEAMALISLAVFFYNLVTCLLWYAFKYDPIGTVNPSWTDIFG
jgi:hypothetical protein